MKNKSVNIEVYKKLICDMIQEITSEKFLHQIYSIVLTERKKSRD